MLHSHWSRWSSFTVFSLVETYYAGAITTTPIYGTYDIYDICHDNWKWCIIKAPLCHKETAKWIPNGGILLAPDVPDVWPPVPHSGADEYSAANEDDKNTQTVINYSLYNVTASHPVGRTETTKLVEITIHHVMGANWNRISHCIKRAERHCGRKEGRQNLFCNNFFLFANKTSNLI